MPNTGQKSEVLVLAHTSHLMTMSVIKEYRKVQHQPMDLDIADMLAN